MDTTTLIAVLSGPLLSAFISFILAQNFDKKFASIFSFLSCLVVTAVVMLLSDKFVLTDTQTTLDLIKLIILNLATVLVSSYTTYEHVWKPTGIADKLNARGPQIGS